MMSSELSATIFGLLSSLSWGAGDFSGGLATKRTNVFNVVIISQIIGLSLLIFLAILFSEPLPGLTDLLWGCLAGLFGSIGLMALYRGLSLHSMGLVAPVSAVITAIIPMTIGTLLEGLPSILKLLGFAIALIAVWLVSGTKEQGKSVLNSLKLPCIAGLGFGLFLVFIDQVNNGAVFWPLAAARITSVIIFSITAVLLRQIEAPRKDHILPIASAGIFDVGGNVFFALATQTGRLDMAAVLATLYPVVTIIFARLVLKEQLTHQQWVGIIAAVFSVLLITC